jgi:hypothetical protein
LDEKKPESFVEQAFLRVLTRHATTDEQKLCREFLETQARRSSMSQARENLIAVLFNHNDFVTIR